MLHVQATIAKILFSRQNDTIYRPQKILICNYLTFFLSTPSLPQTPLSHMFYLVWSSRLVQQTTHGAQTRRNRHIPTPQDSDFPISSVFIPLLDRGSVEISISSLCVLGQGPVGRVSSSTGVVSIPLSLCSAQSLFCSVFLFCVCSAEGFSRDLLTHPQ